jgi:hypothetical protein
MNTEVWAELAEVRKALKQMGRKTREVLAEQAREVAELRAEVAEIAKALAEAGAFTVAA